MIRHIHKPLKRASQVAPVSLRRGLFYSPRFPSSTITHRQASPQTRHYSTSTTSEQSRESQVHSTFPQNKPPKVTVFRRVRRIAGLFVKIIVLLIVGLLSTYYLCFVSAVSLFRRLDGPSGELSGKFPGLAGIIDDLESLHRASRCIYTVLYIGASYFLLLSRYSPVNLYYQYFEPEYMNDEEAQKQRKSQVHTEGATHLLNLFRDQKGLYIKFGQQIAAMYGFIPDEYIQVLKVMRDQAPTIEFDEVRKVILQDLGQPIEEIFATFDEKPLASASLAQVHRATLKDGTVVAVKIQYPYVRTFFESDIRARDVSSRLATKMYHMQEDVEDIDELIELNDSFAMEMKTAMREELNFLLEANNAKRAKNNFKDHKIVYIPSIFDKLTSERVLTMEFIDNACHAADKSGIEKMGFNVQQVAQHILNAFAEQLFCHGLLHADPHPANVFVRRNPKNPKEPQIVILDHGLYKELSDDFRRKYAKFWQSIVLKDDKGIKEYCDNLGIKNHKLYAAMIMMQGYDEVSVGMGGSGIAQEKQMSFEEVQKFSEAMQDKKEDFMNIYRNLPMEMVIIMRTDNLLRSLNQEMGAKVNRFVIMARQAARGVYYVNGVNEDAYANKSWLDRLSMWRGQAVFEFRLAVIRIQNWFVSKFINTFGIPTMLIRQAVSSTVADPDISKELELVEAAKHKK